MQNLTSTLKNTVLGILFLNCFFLPLRAQEDSLIWLQGHEQVGDSTFFYFDAALYGQQEVQRVQVTGSFRNWSQDMEEKAWQLGQIGNSRWKLRVYNPTFTEIPLGTTFKFRINDGQWMDPPAHAPNIAGGNLQAFPYMTPPIFQVELRSTTTIWVRIAGFERPLSPAQYRLTDAHGNSIPLAEFLPNTEEEALLIPLNPLDIRRIYYLEIPGQRLKSWCSFDGWFRELYSTKPLGANIAANESETSFRIFSPRATQVRLHLYRKPTAKKAFQIEEMIPDANGVWEAVLPGNLKGVYYDFTVHGPDEPGNHFFETVPTHISDPYARVNMDAWGRSRVWPKGIPASPLKNGRPPMEDVIAYEVHVQDFSDLLPVEKAAQGTFVGMTTKGLTNKQGEAIGFDYLTQLGINVVHLMPVQEFMHYPDELWKASFEEDSFMQEMGIAEENYQWGYRTSHCFAVESKFRRKGDEPGAERDQFRDLVQAFHDEDIAVIIDIVPNHTAENMDDEPHFFHFNVLDKLYYYRTHELDHIGEYGNEVKTENRPMVQRWLIDQCKHFIEEFGIDGFRIDLAGQIDRQTLEKLREALGPDIILYGEPWIGSNDPAFEQNPSWDWYKHNSPITFFQDESRNAFQGSPFDLYDKHLHRGYAGGNFRLQGKVKAALSANFPEDQRPTSGISYLDIHDNWTLADRFATAGWDGQKGVDEARYKIAAVLLYTSLGPIVTHAGSEIMRSKGKAPIHKVIKTMVDGTQVVTKGRGDTYNLRTPNQFQWETVGQTGKSSVADYAGMHAFWQGLNHFRLSEYGKVFRQPNRVAPDYYRWINTVNPYQLGYLVDERVLVLINVGSETHDWDHVYLPSGTWRLIGTMDRVNHQQGTTPPHAYEQLAGGQTHYIRLAGPTFMIWVRD